MEHLLAAAFSCGLHAQVDGDHTLEEAWRMRLTAERLVRECAHRYGAYAGFSVSPMCGLQEGPLSAVHQAYP